MRTPVVIVMCVLAALPAVAQDLPEGYAPLSETQPIVDKTLRVQLAPDVSALSAAEKSVVATLIEAGEIFQRLHENMRHHQATESHILLSDLDKRLGSPPATQNLLALYYASKGPVVRGLDNARRPMLPVDAPVPGGAVYPWGVTKDEIDAFLAAHPEELESILHPRTVVRRALKHEIDGDLAALNRHRALSHAHPGLKEKLIGLSRHPGQVAFYAVPYAVAYADDLVKVSGLLDRAASAIAAEDADFAGYLRARSQDLIRNDYAAGDSAWVTGHFKNLNAQIGSYENYDDELYGVKTYFGLNVLVRDRARSDALRTATKELQRFEDSLPYNDGKPHKRVRTDIPVGVYDVVADFGQSRGANTATILPNEAGAARKWGRTILLRRNIMADPGLFEMNRVAYAAAVAPEFKDHLTAESNTQRTLWHEIGHYLGVDRTTDGRELDTALENASSVLEEMKADLVSLYLAPELERMGYYTKDARRSLYASGVRRILQKNKPERAQVYQTMQLMQWNYYLARGALSFDAKTGKLVPSYDRFHDAVAAMLRETLAAQTAGDPQAAEAFISKWSEWRPDLHERVAQAMRESERYRFAYVTYAALASAGQ
ncbi:MAG TPA: NUDIX hydrolase [Candidatus Krumholzibacteria bacterium]|nr:NUDIX hydrolase [Candidatus Krumholzibacteria bacterium]